MPEAILKELQRLIRERMSILGTSESDAYQRQCLTETDDLVDEILDDQRRDVDRRVVNEKSYRLLILCGYGGLYGKERGG